MRLMRAHWALLIFLVLVVVGSVAAYRVLGSFDRSLVAYAALCEGEQGGWYESVDEVDPESLKTSLYDAHYWTRSRVPAKATRTWVYTAADGQTVPALRCQGVLYVVVHKWKNFAAGVCVPVAERGEPMEQRGLDYFPISGSRWQLWKADMEK